MERVLTGSTDWIQRVRDRFVVQDGKVVWLPEYVFAQRYEYSFVHSIVHLIGEDHDHLVRILKQLGEEAYYMVDATGSLSGAPVYRFEVDDEWNEVVRKYGHRGDDGWQFAMEAFPTEHCLVGERDDWCVYSSAVGWDIEIVAYSAALAPLFQNVFPPDHEQVADWLCRHDQEKVARLLKNYGIEERT